jgi:hypothetical protein
MTLRQQMIWFSQEDMARELNLDPAIIRKAKKLGCPAFRPNGRIFKEDWHVWYPLNKEKIESNYLDTATDTLTKSKARKLAADAQISELKLAEMKDKFIDIKDAEAFYKKLASSLTAMLKARFIQEAPSKQVGMSAVDIELANTNIVSEICRTIVDKPMEDWK